MYPLFMVGAKLLGIFFVLNGLIEAAVLTSQTRAAFGPQLAIACFLHFMAGTFLTFGTGFVAKVVRIHEELDGESPAISYRSALEVGILLIGVFEFLNFLPRTAVRWFDFSQMIVLTRTLSDLVNPETFGLLGAVLLLLFAHRIAGLLERVNRRPSGPETS